MQRPHGTARLRFLKCILPLLIASLTGCADFRVPALEKLQSKSRDNRSKDKGPKKSAKEKQQAEDDALLAAAQGTPLSGVPGTAGGASVDLTFLLSMDYTEAKAISTQSMELANGGRVAADSIEVLKADKEGVAKKVRAKGKVYLETGAADGAKILCQEAYINGTEAVLRGKPILQRGGSIVEGLDEGTVFYMLGTRLRVIGLHRLTNEGAMIANVPDLGPWTGGPNPLLPPLTEGAVPNNIRAEMLKAAEAEAVLQRAKMETMEQPDAPPAPWFLNGPKTNSKPADLKPESTPPKKEPAPSGADTKTTTTASSSPGPTPAKPKVEKAAEQPARRKAAAVSMRK